MKRYTIQVKISTARAAGGNTVTGGIFNAELDIETLMPIDVEASKTDNDLIAGCVDASQQIPEVRKKGKIIALEIIDIIEKS